MRIRLSYLGLYILDLCRSSAERVQALGAHILPVGLGEVRKDTHLRLVLRDRETVCYQQPRNYVA